MSRTEKLLALISEHQEVIRYLVAGGYNTVFGFLAFAGLYLLLEDYLHYIAVALIAQVVGITNAFIVYRYFVFKSEGNILHEYLKTYVVYGITFVLGIIVLAVQVEMFGLHPILAQGLVILVTVLVSYFGHKLFTFKANTDV